MQFASAISGEDETIDALDEVMEGLSQGLSDEAADLAIVFATFHHARGFETIVRRLHEELGRPVMIGSMAGGVLGSGHELEQRPGLSVLAGCLPGVKIHAFEYEQLDWPRSAEDPAGMRRAILGEVGDDAAAMILFADPFSTPMVKLMPAINAAIPGVPIVGGMASGGMVAGENRMIFNDRVLDTGAVGVALGGNIRVDCTVSQGCRPIGQPWVITQAKHNIIQQIGQQPALKVIQDTAEALAPQEQSLMRQGLLVGRVIDEYKERFGRGDFLIRNIIGADRDSGFIAIADLVRVGQTIQFHVRDKSTAEEDLRLLLEGQKLHGPAAGALLCTCNGRGSNIFEIPGTESRLIGEAIGNAPIAGFFAAGEIGPVGEDNFLHGFTASLAVFRPVEDDASSV